MTPEYNRPMLSMWRRHTPKCRHRAKGRAHTKCNCPIWVDGEVNGRRFRRSTGLKDWQRALRKLALWEPPDAPTLTPVTEAIEAFRIHCRDLAPSTRRKYDNILRLLAAFCEARSIDTMAEVTVEAIDRFRATRKIGPVTATKELQTLRQFCAFCLERGWLTDNVAKRVKPPRNAKPQPIEPYTATEVAAFLKACDSFGRTSYERLRAKAMVLLLRYTGLRISDVSTLARDRIREECILLHTQKTRGLVILPLPQELLEALERVPSPRGAQPGCPYFFWNGIGSRRAVVGTAERTLASVFQTSGVAKAKAHRFRHTLATDILVKGGTEQDVADVLGISPAVVRKHYAKWTPARQQRILALMKAVHSGTFSAHDEKEAVIH